MQRNYTLSASWQSHSLSASDGTKIKAARFANHNQESPDTQYVLFVPGRSEFIEKYNFFAEDLSQGKSLVFVTYDHRGQGGSGGMRSHIEDFSLYMQDLLLVKNALIGQQEFVLLSHSMGALISISCIQSGLLQPKKALLSSPYIGLSKFMYPSWLAVSMTWFMCFLGKGHLRAPAKINLYEGNKDTSSREMYERYLNSPYKTIAPTFTWSKEIIKAQAKLMVSAAKYNIPTLVFIAEDERVVDKGAILQWIQCVKKSDLFRVEHFPTSRHEILCEVEETYQKALTKIKELVYQD